jgi:hypothetical protein
MISAELVSAVAASPAAALSIATLLATTRCEEGMYRPEAMVETLMQLVNASMGGIDNARSSRFGGGSSAAAAQSVVMVYSHSCGPRLLNACSLTGRNSRGCVRATETTSPLPFGSRRSACGRSATSLQGTVAYALVPGKLQVPGLAGMFMRAPTHSGEATRRWLGFWQELTQPLAYSLYIMLAVLVLVLGVAMAVFQ